MHISYSVHSTSHSTIYRVSILQLSTMCSTCKHPVGSPIQTSAIMYYLMTASDGVRWQCCLEGPAGANQKVVVGQPGLVQCSFSIHTITYFVRGILSIPLGVECYFTQISIPGIYTCTEYRVLMQRNISLCIHTTITSTDVANQNADSSGTSSTASFSILHPY